MCRPTQDIVEPTTAAPCTMELRKQQQMRKRRVTFQDEPSRTTVASFTHLPEEVQEQIWYRKSDIGEFRSNARDLCRKLRRQHLLFTEESMRGLEFRTDPDRQLRKDLTMKCFLKAQRRTSDARTLAQIYRKCNAWTIVASAVVARSDFFDAYELKSTCDTTVPTMDNYPLPFRVMSHRKRVAKEPSSPADSVRRVRRRTEGVVNNTIELA